MTNNLNVNDNLYGYDNMVEEFRKDTGDTMSFSEDITVMKTEVKEEYFDFETPVEDMEFVNVKEEYSSPENNFMDENWELRNSEQSFNENIDAERCEFRQTDLLENKYRCELCHFDFDNETYLKCHYEQCRVVKKELSKEDLHLNGDNTGQKYKCEHCTFSTSGKHSFTSHVTQCIHAKGKPFKCAYKNCKCTPEQKEQCMCNTCGYTATTQTRLDQHVLLRHSTTLKKYKCNDCNYATHRKHHLEGHIRTHTNYRPFKCIYKNCICMPGQDEPCKCDTCGYAAAEKDTLHKHVLAKHSARTNNFKCNDCNYTTHVQKYLNRHLLTHSNGKPYKCVYKNCTCAPEQTELCNCNKCDYATTTKSRLNQHILLRHSTVPKKYKCEDCHYASHIEANLKQHILIHADDKPFKCTYKNCACTPEQKELCECSTCDFATTTKKRLNHHVLLRHLPVEDCTKQYKCKNCEYATRVKASLVIHSRTHTGDRPFKCTYKNCKCAPGQDKPCKCGTCEYAAIEKCALQRHVLAKHSVKLKKFECGHCEYATHMKRYLKRHLLTHTNEKPYKCMYKHCKCTTEQKEFCKCNTCEYAAATKTHLNNHILVKHSTVSKKYKCNHCEYTTHMKTSLVLHSHVHSGDKPFKCVYKNCICTPEGKEFCECNTCQYATTTRSRFSQHVLERHGIELKK